MHQEKPRIRQVKRTTHRRRAQFMDVTSKQFHLAQLKRRHYRTGPLNGRLVEVDAHHSPARTHHLRQDGKPAKRAAAALDGMPAFLDSDPAEGRTRHLARGLGNAEQPPKILIAAIEDVAPDPVRDRLRHDRSPLPP